MPRTMAKKPWSFWQHRVHAYLDNKAFPVYLSPKARAYAAKLRGARGTFRKKGGGLAKGHVKPRRTLKENFGPRNVMIAAGISAGKVIMWHEVKGQWNAEAARKSFDTTPRDLSLNLHLEQLASASFDLTV